jgi:hypothetical protein
VLAYDSLELSGVNYTAAASVPSPAISHVEFFGEAEKIHCLMPPLTVVGGTEVLDFSLLDIAPKYFGIFHKFLGLLVSWVSTNITPSAQVIMDNVELKQSRYVTSGDPATDKNFFSMINVSEDQLLNVIDCSAGRIYFTDYDPGRVSTSSYDCIYLSDLGGRRVIYDTHCDDVKGISEGVRMPRLLADKKANYANTWKVPTNEVTEEAHTSPEDTGFHPVPTGGIDHTMLFSDAAPGNSVFAPRANYVNNVGDYLARGNDEIKRPCDAGEGWFKDEVSN